MCGRAVPFRFALLIAGLRPKRGGIAREDKGEPSVGAKPPPHIGRHSRKRQAFGNWAVAEAPEGPNVYSNGMFLLQLRSGRSETSFAPAGAQDKKGRPSGL